MFTHEECEMIREIVKTATDKELELLYKILKMYEDGAKQKFLDRLWGTHES